MEVKVITSARNSLLRKMQELKEWAGRKEQGLFLVEGLKLIGEAQAKGVVLSSVIVSKAFFNDSPDNNKLQQHVLAAAKDIVVVEDKLFDTLCTTDTSCGIVASAAWKKWSLQDLLGRNCNVLVFGECIQDPGNLGTIIRTALAFNIDGLILGKGSVDYLSPKVVRASMGAVFSLPIVANQDVNGSLSRLKTKKFHLVALDAKATTRFDRQHFPHPTVYLFGNEGHGLSPKVMQMADNIVSIPIGKQSESLNVAVAMGIILCHADAKCKEKND